MTWGVLEVGGRGAGHLRRRETGFLPDRGDVQVPAGLIARWRLRPGDEIEGKTGGGRESGTLTRIETVNGIPADRVGERPDFTRLTAVHPDEPLLLECHLTRGGQPDLTNRVIDLLCPFGKGQRALIVAPAKAGKTTVLQDVAQGLKVNHPASPLFLLLVDERPEEVFEMESAGAGEVVASSFDQGAEQHVRVAELLLERARRRVELGQDVVIIMDSLTRLARAYNSVGRGSGRTLSGGMDAESMEKPKRFLGSARKIAPAQGGGSLTIIATALVDTGSKMDQLIFEEFKGTGNSELVLSRELAERRVFPAIDLMASGTRREELLLPPEALRAAQVLRQRMARMTPLAAMTDLLTDLRRYRDNRELVLALGR